MTDQEREALRRFVASAESSLNRLRGNHNGRYNKMQTPPSPVAPEVRSTDETRRSAPHPSQPQRGATQLTEAQTQAVAAAAQLGIPKARAIAAARQCPADAGAADVLKYILSH